MCVCVCVCAGFPPNHSAQKGSKKKGKQFDLFIINFLVKKILLHANC